MEEAKGFFEDEVNLPQREEVRLDGRSRELNQRLPAKVWELRSKSL